VLVVIQLTVYIVPVFYFAALCITKNNNNNKWWYWLYYQISEEGWYC